MQLPTERRKPTKTNPNTLILFGPTKVGKTTVLSDLDDCLIIDTEIGSKYISGLIQEVNSLTDLAEVKEALVARPKPYTYIAIDVIDNVVTWVEEEVARVNGIKHFSDLAYGAGYGQVREMTLRIVKQFSLLTEHLIIIGHRKKTIIGSETLEFSVDTLDLSGKLKNMLCANVDAIGYMFRETDDSGESKLKVSFQSADELEVGTRPTHLRGKVFEFDWKKVYL